MSHEAWYWLCLSKSDRHNNEDWRLCFPHSALKQHSIKRTLFLRRMVIIG